MNQSAASIYQIDERGLELRRSYMRMTAAEFELLAGMQAWAQRNCDAIGKALAEHTFIAGPAGGFLREYANSKGMPVEALKQGWGSAQAGFPSIASDWRVTNLLSSRAWPALGFRDTFMRLHRAVGH